MVSGKIIDLGCTHKTSQDWDAFNELGTSIPVQHWPFGSTMSVKPSIVLKLYSKSALHGYVVNIETNSLSLIKVFIVF